MKYLIIIRDLILFSFTTIVGTAFFTLDMTPDNKQSIFGALINGFIESLKYDYFYSFIYLVVFVVFFCFVIFCYFCSYLAIKNIIYTVKKAK